jgi:hypothetical protein
MIGIGTSIAVAILSGLFVSTVTTIGNDLKTHGEALAGIKTALQDLAAGQIRIEASVNDRFGAIVNVQRQLDEEMAGLKQAEADDRMRSSHQGH